MDWKSETTLDVSEQRNEIAGCLRTKADSTTARSNLFSHQLVGLVSFRLSLSNG